jgi:transposase
MRIPLSKFVLALKFFVLEVPVNRAYKELGISSSTLHKVYSLVHETICHCTSKDAHLLKGEVEVDESYFGGKGKGNRGREAEGKVTAFGILAATVISAYYLGWTRRETGLFGVSGLHRHHGCEWHERRC